jgi:hypothetical protein
VLKAYRDVMVDGRDGNPLDSQDALRQRDPAEFRREDIGYLTERHWGPPG